MRKLYSFLTAAVIVGTAALAINACTELWGSDKPKVKVSLIQAEDSALFVIWWAPGQIRPPRQSPIDHWNVAIVLVDSAIQVTTGTTGANQHRDTLAVAYPAVGDTLGPMFASVTAVDLFGAESDPGVSAEFSLVTTPLPPSPPDSVTVDSTLVNPVVAVHVVPNDTTVVEGTILQLCAIVVFQNDEVAVDPDIPYCQDRLTEWLSTRSVLERRIPSPEPRIRVTEAP
jgi:hypothetical protein